ncbi:MAG: FISUMP domain-containing protein, partial [Ignavibacteriaceae bacterium]|nr:FISUMP domain-containing protein [Ignavibacteriaceae bacterium]
MKHIFLIMLLYTSGYAQKACKGIDIVNYSGQKYTTVQIGNQCWLKENLNVGVMINGSSEQTNNGIIEKYCYQNDPANCIKYGGLYQWNEA